MKNIQCTQRKVNLSDIQIEPVTNGGYLGNWNGFKAVWNGIIGYGATIDKAIARLMMIID